MNALNTLITLLKLLPAIVAAIQALEAALPASGAGKAKLASLREIMVAVDSGVTAIWPSVEAAVGVIVKLMNTGKEKAVAEVAQ